MDNSIISSLKSKDSFYFSGGVLEEEIKQAEQKLEMRFDSQYREYVRQFGVASFEGHELTGICPFPRLNVVDVTIAERDRMNSTADKLYVLERTNIDDVTIWQSTEGSIYAGQPGRPLKTICYSLEDYINDNWISN